MMRKVLSVILSACLVIGMTACSGSASKDSATSAEGSETSAAVSVGQLQNAINSSSEAQTEAETRVLDESKRREITISTPNEPKKVIVWDPDANIANYDAPFIYQQFETPLKMMPDGSITGLVAQAWDFSEDGLTFTLHLKDNVIFSNGDKCTAEDVAWSISQIAASRTGAAYYPGLQECKADGELDVVLTFERPYPGIIMTMVHRMSLIYDKSYYGEVGMEGYTQDPVGTGPYIRTEHVLADHQTMTARDDYWDEDNKPFYQKVTVKFLTDANAQMLALENGEVDILLQASIGPFLMLPENSNIGYDTTAASSILGMTMNMLYGPTSDLRFRQALQYAVNRDEINLGVYEGYATPNYNFCLPMYVGAPDEDMYTPAPSYDPEKAKELLADMGYNGEEYILVSQSGTKADLAAQIIQGELMNVGINCTIKSLDSASANAAVKAGEGWNSMIKSINNSAMAYAGSLKMACSYDFRMISGQNAPCAVRDDDWEDRLEAASYINDEQEQKRELGELCTVMNEDARFIPLLAEFNVVGYNKEIKGVHAYPFNGVIYFTDLY